MLNKQRLVSLASTLFLVGLYHSGNITLEKATDSCQIRRYFYETQWREIEPVVGKNYTGYVIEQAQIYHWTVLINNETELFIGKGTDNLYNLPMNTYPCFSNKVGLPFIVSRRLVRPWLMIFGLLILLISLTMDFVCFELRERNTK